MSKLELMPHQTAGVRFLVQNDRCGLFDDPGLGKTAQAIEALAEFVPFFGRGLVLAPKSVVLNWKKEFGLWRPDLRVQCLSSGFDQLDPSADVVVLSHNLSMATPIRRQLLSEKWAVCVLDEAHFFRKLSAKRTLAFYTGADALVKACDRVWLLTGTPMVADPRNWYVHVRALRPGLLAVLRDGKRRAMLFSEFARRFCVLKPPFRRGAEERCVAIQNEAELQRRLSPFYLRRTVDELDLPPIRFGTVYVDGKLLLDVQHFGDKLARQLESLPVEEAFSMLQDQGRWSELRRLIGLAKAPSVASLVSSWLDDSDHDPVVVFAYHKQVIDSIVESLRLLGHVVVSIDGRSNLRERTDAVEAFQRGDAQVFVGQLQAAGTGVTLTKSRRLLFAEKSWTPGENVQAFRRIYRKTQTRSCLVQTAVLADSLDEVVERIVERKTDWIERVVR